ncbi:MAG: hypothetical protein HUJ71_04470, partial [Pseudobutyrivibrio sp.]|nr:hypothetical protein [Pseudobutyrivibrio sp.]
LYVELKPDLFKLQQAILIELGKYNIEHTEILTELIVVDIMLRYINVEYDDAVEYMKTVFPANYDSWYGSARCSKPSRMWGNGLDEFGRKFVPDDLDLNNITTIKNGLKIIQKKMHSLEVKEAAKREASQSSDGSGGEELYNKSLEILGIRHE